jgi:hypothetical protein
VQDEEKKLQQQEVAMKEKFHQREEELGRREAAFKEKLQQQEVQ